MNDDPETQLASLNETPTPAKSRRWLWVGLGSLLLLVLAAAAYLGGRYLQNAPSTASGGNGPMISRGGPGGGETSIEIGPDNIVPAEELPETRADVAGIFVRRQDNSVFVGTGQIEIFFSVDPSDDVQSGSNYDGPLVEVVTTNDTQIYRDDTFEELASLPSGAKIQQKVLPGSLDEIGENSGVNAWGKKVGDRLVADVLVYTNPGIVTAP